MKTPFRRCALRAAGLLALFVLLWPPAASAQDAPTLPRSDTSYYLAMRDGVRLAVSIYYPAGTEPSQPAPALLVQTRYGRARFAPRYQRFRDDGYVIAIVDTRGSTSSFGTRRVDIGPAEVADMEELVAHIGGLSWSNGNVFAIGTSYLADTADVLTSRPAPKLKGSVIREVDWDVFLHLFNPGGVANDWFLFGWGNGTLNMDLGRGEIDGKSVDCAARAADCPKLWPVLQAVDGDTEYALLRSALGSRNRWLPSDYADAEFHDDAGKNGYPLFASSPASHLANIRAEKKPAQVWGSWVDGGTAAAAIARFNSAPKVPMEIWITANDHLNHVNADPFIGQAKTPMPSLDEQHRVISGFFEMAGAGRAPKRVIHYYVLGAMTFRTATTWPPRGVAEKTLYLTAAGGLENEKPSRPDVLSYNVDFSAGTGEFTRWSTQSGIPPHYPDRREGDGKLVVFDSTPFAADTEIAGFPVVDLHMASRTDDPAVFVYLEDVAPDGRVSYLTEGVFRAVNRKPADPKTLPWDQGPAPHSYRREDALAVQPGEVMRLRFSMFPVAARIAKGHRLRLAVAGADASYFRLYSGGGPDVFDIHTGSEAASSVTVAMRPWG